MSSRVPDKVKETVIEEVDRVKHLTTKAARSGTYLYPIKGIYYFVAHKSLWRPLLSKLVPTITLGIGILTFMFVFTYVPQATVLAIFNGPLAFFSSALLVLSESSTLLNVLSKTFIIEEALVDTFDGTLLAEDMTSVVAQGRQINSGADPIAKLGKLFKKPFEKFSPKAIIRYFMYLPLNFIPVVGTVMFIILQGRRNGPSAHNRYFQLKKWTGAEKEEFIEERKAEYTSFGTVTTLLELVPVAGIFLSFTNTVGAALWAADIEKGNTTAPKLVEKADKAS
ncbi:MAG: hypothetical protein M1824_002724 [Vezdaea acicularis]|nr:MAG: hypothetical protein M1824_002724 [Vezdaea acicularis]